ncbi:hypothetical protein LTR94_029418, partial [Friedmanniomyces endolithicus]
GPMSDTELATARVRQLLELTQKLTQRLSDETKAFQEGRPQDVAASLAHTQEMANVYRRDSAHAARKISEGLVRAIAHEVAASRTPASAYAADGRAAQGDGRAVAFNRKA